ncbi:mannose-6-phosphate isomerase [Lentinus tigrinus ALCF2SS1-7]|uniref:Mannose-6-phosphate isomerase n=1 Tax=Lentinus tigrinus ALCF2SS1-6 TaxID=1328759 RepID=A0A5C2SBE6_9APHY|nr:mannose-6-phosphate isomerase [Lentinus tigrinus ALCF2SS1-6]RPD75236.1 mannose-6-phosphate isomerase [Lentinus tigrinus ALCF2SS1-7]
MPAHKNLIRIQAAKQEYDWGRQGSSSLAARLASNAIGHGFQVDENKSYAEIWMGTHTNGPARLYDSPSTPLLSLISSDPTFYLGETLVQKWPSTTHIPYLFKVLSIQKALPLQAHPDKDLAKQLQLKDPSNFVDSNHKPEIAVAIGEPLATTRSKVAKRQGDEQEVVGDTDTAFTGFVGFRPLEEIKGFLQAVPELGEAIGDSRLVSSFIHSPSKDLLRQIFGKLLKRGVEAREELVKPISQLQDRIKQSGGNLGFYNSEELARLVLKVNKQYPGDAGVLATTFFMNFAKLRKGESIYIGADEIHAYLEGDIIECMAVSDNVVNAAFDEPSSLASQVDTFVNMLTYTARPVSHWSLPAQKYQHAKSGRTVKYDPPIEEFIVLGTFLSMKNAKEEHLGAVDGPTMGIVTRGKVRISTNKGGETEQLELDEGAVVFVAAKNEINVEILEGHGPDEAGEVWWSLFGA